MPTDPENVKVQLDRILNSRPFVRSTRLRRFLEFCVQQVLAGRADALKEQVIGVEVFDRASDYDPRIDPIVRVEARRLRAKLKAYYGSPGRTDVLLIGLPKGSYVPVFRSRAAATSAPIAIRPVQPAPETGPKSIAVLPFANLSTDPDEDYFSDGLAEELIHRLTRIENLRVVAWPSASRLRGREEDLAGIRQQLRVDTILRGSVRRTPGRVRVTAQLIATASGDYLWSGAYDRDTENIFVIQEEIARAIVRALQPTLVVQSPRLRKQSPQALASYQLCLQGKYLANARTRNGLERSLTRFEEAILADPSSAQAHSGLADAYSLLADYGFLSPLEAAPRALAAAENALKLDPDSAEAHVSLAFIRAWFEWKYEDAERLYRTAIALNPGDSRAHHWLGVDHLALMGRFDEAATEMDRARDLDPLSAIIYEGCGYVQMLSRNYTGAMAIYRDLTDIAPSFHKGRSSMGRVLSLLGRYEEAIVAFEQARSLDGDTPSILGALGQTLAAAGRIAEAQSLLQKLETMSQAQWVPASSLAIVHVGLGNHQTALQFLETAADQRELPITALKVHPLYDPLRSEPRFERLLRRLGFLP